MATAHVLTTDPQSDIESANDSAASWAAIVAGGVVIGALTLVLLAFGAGMGFASGSFCGIGHGSVAHLDCARALDGNRPHDRAHRKIRFYAASPGQLFCGLRHC